MEHYFTTSERILLARYLKVIKLECKDAYFELPPKTRQSILNYASKWNNPDKYRASNKSVFVPEEDLIAACDIEKIRRYFEPKLNETVIVPNISASTLQHLYAVIDELDECGRTHVGPDNIWSAYAKRIRFMIENIFEIK